MSGESISGSARDRINVSKSETAHIHDKSGWNPSGAGGPTRRCRLIFAGAKRRIAGFTGSGAEFIAARCCLGLRLSSHRWNGPDSTAVVHEMHDSNLSGSVM